MSNKLENTYRIRGENKTLEDFILKYLDDYFKEYDKYIKLGVKG